MRNTDKMIEGRFVENPVSDLGGSKFIFIYICWSELRPLYRLKANRKNTNCNIEQCWHYGIWIP